MSKSLLDEIKPLIKGEVEADEKTLEEHSTDASVFYVRPEVVVYPMDAEDVKAVVSFVSQEKENGRDISVTARSAGTCMSGGSLTESIVLDVTRHMNNLKEVRELDESNGRIAGYATAEPGMFYRDFEKETLEKGLLFPSYPASRELCALGGIVSNNAGGEKTLKYGKTEDYIRGLKIVLADGNEYEVRPLSGEELSKKKKLDSFEGELYRSLHNLIEENYEKIMEAKPQVSKNSAGYYLWNVWDKNRGVFDLPRLIVGSQGTFGIITEITLNLVRPDPHSQMAIIFLKSLDNVGELVKTVLKYEPVTFESYDDKTLKLALKFFFSFLKRLGLRNVLILAINGIPEAFSILRKGLPKLVLQITFEGEDKDELLKRADRLIREVKDNFDPQYAVVEKSQKEAEGYWLIRRESFNLLRHKVKGMKTAPVVDDIVVRTEVLPEFLPEVNAIFEKYEGLLIYNIAGHIGNGNFHIIPLMDFKNEKARDAIPKVMDEVYSLVIRYGGSITAEHNDGLVRTPYLLNMYGRDIVELFKKTKDIFDPLGIFNPRKKVNGDMDYALAHLKKG